MMNRQMPPGKEIQWLRTANSRTFAAEDGQRRAVVYERPVNYLNAWGKWRAINSTLVSARKHGDGYVNSANRYSLHIPRSGSKPIRLASGDFWLDVELAGTHGLASIDGNTAMFQVGSGLSVAYTAGSDGLEAKLILAKRHVPTRYRLRINASSGLSLKQSGGEIVAVDPEGEVRFSLPSASAIDDAGEAAALLETALEPVSGSYMLTLELDPLWLKDRERAFPVELIQAVIAAQSDSENAVVQQPTNDCMIASGLLRRTSLCGASVLGTGARHGMIQRTLLSFDVAGSLPGDVRILGARVGLFEWRRSGYRQAPVDLHSLSKAFTDKATWIVSEDGNPWLQTGGDFEEPALASTTLDKSRGFEWWDLSEISALQGAAEGGDDYGLLLKQHGEATSASHGFLSSEYWNASLRPRLEITYEPKEEEELPPPQAPDLPETGFPPFSEQASFLFEGPDPVQTGVADGTIRPVRAAVVRGQVMTRDGLPLAGVKMSVLGHPELGETKSRIDGSVYMAVNGGGPLTIALEKEGYLESQRRVEAPWQDYVWMEDVVLVPLDDQVTEIEAGSEGQQVARGNVVSDERGTRQGTLIFEPGTSASMTMADGSARALDDLSVRITEYTVGGSGQEAMPAELPPTSAYTYAVEFSVDEAIEAGATEVGFNKPVVSYTENFVGFKVGDQVPVGYYEREKSRWIASHNGRVIKVLSTSGGLAELDIDGSGEPASEGDLTALGITELERERVASLYEVGQSLWRVPITHFSAWDCNWPWGLPPDAIRAWIEWLKNHKPSDDDCEESGSIISCMNQGLGEEIPIAGTPLKLRYQSEYAAGRASGWSFEVPISGETVPASVKSIKLRIAIGGHRYLKSFSTEPNQTYAFAWDGKDLFGRPVTTATATVELGYVYDGIYRTPNTVDGTFALYNENPSSFEITYGAAAPQMTLWDKKTAQLELGVYKSLSEGLGGWTLNVHNAYDAKNRTFYGGNGRRRTADLDSRMLQRSSVFAGNGEGPDPGDGGPATDAFLSNPEAVEVGPDGSVYIAERGNGRIRRISTEGDISRVAGGGSGSGEDGFGDGGPASQASISEPEDIALGADGSLFISDSGHNRVRRVSPDGVIETIAGGGEADACAAGGGLGDYEPAAEVALCEPGFLDVARDGSIYFGEGPLLRRIGPDGLISTVTGRGSDESETAPVNEASTFGSVGPIAVDPTGVVYFVAGDEKLKAVGPDGMVRTPVDRIHSGGGGTEMALMTRPPKSELSNRALAVAPDGSLLIVKPDQLLRIEHSGRIAQVPADLDVAWDMKGVGVKADGELLVSDGRYVRYIRSPFPGFTGGNASIASEDGRLVDIFDSQGRQLRSLDAMTGETVYSFTYSGDGFIRSIVDGFGNETVIERTEEGIPVAITAPFGQRTQLQLQDGFLSKAIDPSGAVISMETSNDGLLTSLTDGRGGTSYFTYDRFGGLIRDQNADGFSVFLEETASEPDSRGVMRVTDLGRSTDYRATQLGNGEQVRTVTAPSGLTSRFSISSDGRRSLETPDGMLRTTSMKGSTLFATQASYPNVASLLTPGHPSIETEREDSIEQVDPENPLSVVFESRVTSSNRTYKTQIDNAQKNFVTTSPEGRMVSVEYGRLRKPLAEKVAGLETQGFQYDGHGRLSQHSFGDRNWFFQYDSRGNIQSATDPLGRATDYTYDAIGRVTSETLLDGRAISYAYDENGNLTSIKTPGREAATFTYDSRNNPLSASLPNEQEGVDPVRYEWDPDGNLFHTNRPDGSEIWFDYDPTGRLSVIASADEMTEFVYNGDGALSSVFGPGGVALQLEHQGPLPTGRIQSGPVPGSVRWKHDNELHVSSMWVNSSTPISFQYDRDGLLTRAGALSISRDPASGFVNNLNLGQYSTSYERDTYGQRTKAYSAASGEAILNFDYTYDPIGRISRTREGSEYGGYEIDYGYDGAGRLVEVKADGDIVESYTYDENGNRTSAIDFDGNTRTATYDVRDRLESFGSNTYTYTPNGEVAVKSNSETGETTIYNYDSFGILNGVLKPDGERIEYVIDPQGRRIGKKTDGNLVSGFLYSELPGPVAEVKPDGSVKSRFIYASMPNTPDYMVRDGKTFRIVSDERGSPRLVIDIATDQVAQEIYYDSFGQILYDSNPGFQPFGFAGGLYDFETGLTLFGAREYDAETGRFTSQDPLGFFGSDTNLYTYAGNDPVNFTDPSGLIDLTPGFDMPSFDDVIRSIPRLPYEQQVSDFFAGYGDNMTFGLTRTIRGWWGGNDAVDFCSGAYRMGGDTGMAMSIVVPGGSGKFKSFRYIVKKFGINEYKASQAIHAAKEAIGYRGDVFFDEAGNIIMPKTGEIIGNIHDFI